MSLTNDDKQYIDRVARQESDRLELLIEDVRSDTTKILELLSDTMQTNKAVKDHNERIAKLEQTETLVVSTLSLHSQELKKLSAAQ